MPEDAKDDPFVGLRLDEAFVRSARALEPSHEDRLRPQERRIISLDEERARRRGGAPSPSTTAAAAAASSLLPLPTPRAVAIIAALCGVALLLGGLPPFLR